MATNKTVPELDATATIQDTDLIEVTVDLGGGNWGSYKATISTLKNEIAYKELTKKVFSGAGTDTYQVARYEKVVGYTFVQASASDTIKISNNATSEIYIDTTDANSGDINHYSTDSTASNRVLKIELSAAGTVYIHSIKNLIP